MNSHENARLTPIGRGRLIGRIALIGVVAAAAECGISVRTAQKWQQRYARDGAAGLWDRSSRPHRVRAALSEADCAQALMLRSER